MGNDYRVKSEYYGGYPATYLRRIKALFPDMRRVLHLFSGKVNLSAFPGDTVDVNKSLVPTYLDDAQTLEAFRSKLMTSCSRTLLTAWKIVTTTALAW